MTRAKLTLLAAALLFLVLSPISADEPKGKPGPRDVGKPKVDLGLETATHEEIEPLAVEFEVLTCLRLAPDGRLLAGDGRAKQIKVIDSRGKQIDTISLKFGPEAVDVAPDGTIYCGGEGKLAKLTATGKLLVTADVPGDASTEITSKRKHSSRPLRVSGIAVSGGDLFVAFGSGWSMGSKSKLFRLDSQFANPVLLAEGLRGCCQRCDIVAADGLVYLAENSVHRVAAYNREGTVVSKWGERSRTELEGFGSCCNPMNLCMGPGGAIYTAESGLGRVKAYSTSGEYLDLIGYVGVERFTRAGGLAASCSNIAIETTPDGRRVYVMDYKNNLIRVLRKKGG